MKNVLIDNFQIGKDQPLALISGPCVIENEKLCFEVAEFMTHLCRSLGIHYIFKASFDKANRSSIESFRGPGVKEGLRILKHIKEVFNIPVVTDIHTEEQAYLAAEVCDMIQVPAFLCRQTDLVLAASKTGKVVSVKKGQFMAPWDMRYVVDKIRSTGNENILLVDRGVSFGYNNLVSDMRAIPIMQQLGTPVCFDATHSVQLPGGLGGKSGGERQFIKTLACSAIAAGANCLFMEAHPNPEVAKSDAASQIPLKELPAILETVLQIYRAVNHL